ncbi:hypothetical protein J2R99_003527 [Rhodopseudomonas julia]|uniref:Uncharacterized protein n=1 Tax=Rhodopseudomonas julia TaxID=200617 RepID=A0ABU0CAU6_9BRAD|nr:hypothetical protein [Rhodopseudomonas julia]
MHRRPTQPDAHHRQVSWLAAPSKGYLPSARAPVALPALLSAHSCGGSYGFGPSWGASPYSLFILTLARSETGNGLLLALTTAYVKSVSPWAASLPTCNRRKFYLWFIYNAHRLLPAIKMHLEAPISAIFTSVFINNTSMYDDFYRHPQLKPAIMPQAVEPDTLDAGHQAYRSLQVSISIGARSRQEEPGLSRSLRAAPSSIRAAYAVKLSARAIEPGHPFRRNGNGSDRNSAKRAHPSSHR